MIEMLENYLMILAGEREPSFRTTRRFPTRLTREDLETAQLDELWREHDRAMSAMKSAAASPSESHPKGISEDFTDLLQLKAAISGRMLSHCCFCARCCGADRAAGELGECGVPALSRYASEFLHYGEERELVPSHTIFFTGCTFRCVYCQNWDIATRPLSGLIADPVDLARAIDAARRSGSRNVNFVGGNPDSHLHTCLRIITHLQTDVPVVWNSNSYASRETMRLLDGAVDIFLSDFRYGNDRCARTYSGIARYWSVVTRNFIDAANQAEVILRHLVLPGHLDCCTEPIMRWVSEHIPDVYFNLMFQYRPEYRAREFAQLSRPLTAVEKRKALEMAAAYGIKTAG